jgi:V/A-type H+-transporting ATPase subunit E
MNSKVSELTEKIYKEGVEKANIEAEKIIGSAEEKAKQILESAEKKKSELLNSARKDAQEIKQNAESEIRLASEQLISALKQRINTVITTGQIKQPVNDAFKDSKFIQNIILSVIKKWNPESNEDIKLSLLISKTEEEQMTAFFESKAKHILNAGLEVKFDQKIKNGFKIGPKGGSYFLSFTDRDFENFFKEYLKEKTKKLLFGE